MHTVEDIRLHPVWVNPEHLVATARHIMSGHGVKMLAVLEGARIVGMVTDRALACAPDNDTVSSHIAPLDDFVSASTTIRDAAEMFIEKNLDAAAVVKNDRFVGVLTSQILLSELKHSWDPLTGLPWSDRLRDWGTENLKAGKEITILFFDVDDFGVYNKRYGHIVGDRVLKNVAQALGEGVDSSRDVLVRYGGDEFAVGTIRDREHAEALGRNMKMRVDGLFLEDSDEPITMSLGIYGGKRSHERENVHYAATLDNLINLASKDCIAHKRSMQGSLPLEKDDIALVQPGGVAPRQMPKVVGVYSDENAPNSLTIVILNAAGTIVSGVHQRAGKTVVQSIAAATGKALQRLDRDTQYVVDDVLMVEEPGGDKLLTINGRVVRGDEEKEASTMMVVSEDLYRSTVEATMQAFAADIKMPD